RMVQMLLSESLLLACMGGLMGLALAYPSVKLLLRLIPIELPFWMRIEVDWDILIFNLTVAVMTGVLFGLVPALKMFRLDLSLALRSGANGLLGSLGAHRLRHTLVMVEIALSLVLLVGAGLMMQSFLALQRASTGIETEHLLAIETARFVANATPEESVQ